MVDVTGGTQDQSHSTPRKNTGAPPETPCGGPVNGGCPVCGTGFQCTPESGALQTAAADDRRSFMAPALW
ncbi:hypothetical protein DESPIG_02170 [Desulfovibrio piger ATCC 29098]|uniref:Uncharacterized protein n=1 Tax=Desulfovibrio piger ATCC 29098 TaxID=411464 RepID=B6WVQ3_9BACT|nr:hypothetical protein DESPIG_02170 [Desulfovibrio piger ATCC 29098]